MVFEGKYFDGKSAAGYPARVELSSLTIELSYTTPQGPQHASWVPDKIHANDFTGRGVVYLKYGEYPHQYLEVNDPNFERELKDAFPKAKFHHSTYNAIFSTGAKGIIAITVGFIALVLVGYFYALPAFAESVAGTIPISWEEEFGDAAYGQMMEMEIIDDKNTKLANEFFKEMGYQSDYNINITVTKNSVVNAYALPGGKIVVYEGILRSMDTPEEFAALLSHEYSHVALRHSTKNIFRSLSSYLLFSLVVGDAGGIAAVIVQNADQLKQLGYSRGLEEEADRNGLKLMKEKQIDPNGMENLLKTLKKEEGDAEVDESMEFLSSHPLTKQRMQYIQKEIDKEDYNVKANQRLADLWQQMKINVGNEADEE